MQNLTSYLNEADYIEWKHHNRDLKKPIVDHGNPEDYGLTQEDADKIKLRYLKQELKRFRDQRNSWNRIVLNVDVGSRWLAIEEYNKASNAVEKIKKSIYFLKNKDKIQKLERFDLERLKQIPIGEITEVMPNGFFRNNPFREEKSPSNSLYWNKKTNGWVDYGSGEYGSNIDLVMKLRDCSFIDSCKWLNGK